ncbi:MAG: serine/threonine-protein kinase [Kofleriaceae bacterium]
MASERHDGRGGTTRLGSYEIIRGLARGGMAELFLARSPGKGGFEKVVVLKKILPKYAYSARMVQLFLDEARLAASLNHSNIVQVYDVGNDGGDYFFAMEYLHGQDVRSILHRAWQSRDQVPLRHAIHVATHVAAALHYAHERRRSDGSLLGIVHRDVSPSNILVSYDGAVKLVDFGVAKTALSTVKTRTGTLRGKISYMSPEQAKGAPIDRRSDIFSLGIVLWEMVTTQRLFRGENDLQTLQLIINQPPRRPSEVQPACSPALERIILRALAQDVDERYQTAEELLHELDALAHLEGMTPSPAALSSYVGTLFDAELRSWHAAQERGVALSEHLTSIGDLTTPISESDFIEAFDLDAMIEEDDEETAEADDTIGPVPMPVMPPAEIPPPAMPPPAMPPPAMPVMPPPAMPPPAMPPPAMPPPMDPAFAAAPALVAPSNPWPFASGSSPVTPSRPFPAAPPPPLDPWAADRILRRGVRATYVVLAIVLLLAILKGA